VESLWNYADSGNLNIWIKKRLEKKETCPVQLGRTQVPHLVDWRKTRCPAVRDRPLTAWTTAGSLFVNLKSVRILRLEAAQMKCLRHLLGITKLEKEKNRCIREKTVAENVVKEIKQYQKVATTRTEDGQTEYRKEEET
jgi:hypothetical protein